MRKTSSAPTRVWKCGARPPTEHAQEVRDQLYLAGRYRNDLVALARQRYETFRQIRRRHSPEFARLDDEYQAVDGAISAIYASVKSNRANVYRRTGGVKTLDYLPPEHRAQIETLKLTRQTVSAQLSRAGRDFIASLADARDAFKAKVDVQGPNNQTMATCKARALEEMGEEGTWPEAFIEVTQSDLEYVEAKKALRANCQLSSGTYLQVEAAVEKAIKDSPLPNFKAFRGDGKIAVQIPKHSNGPDKGQNVTWGNILAGQSNRFQLIDLDHESSRGRHYRARINIGRDRQDMWAEFPVKIHRRPPMDAAVKWVWITSRREAGKIRYELQITLEHKALSAPKPAGTGETHVRIGWGQGQGGIIVATYGDGEHVTVPQSILDQGTHADAIQGHADVHYDGMKALLRKLYRPTTDEERETFEELLSPRTHAERRRILLRQRCGSEARGVLGNRTSLLWNAWKAHRLLHRLDLYAEPQVISRWLRAQGVSIARERLAFIALLWVRKDEHLRQYQADSSRRFTARRLAFFRQEAARIATQFETVTVDGYNIANLKRLPELNDRSNRPNDTAQSNLHEAAPGLFRQLLLEVLGPRGTKISSSEIEGSSDAESPGPSRVRGNRHRTTPQGSSEGEGGVIAAE